MPIEVGQVAMIPYESIEVSDRARQEFGDLAELEGSLTKSGLAQPLAVQQLTPERFRLLAGERRYRILGKHNTPVVPVRIYQRELSPLEIKEIELAENFYRKDFEYWERDALIAEIDSIRKELFGAKAPGPGQSGWSQKDTAAMVGVTNASVSTAIKRAEAREAFPELFANCKTQKDATKVMQKMDEALTKEIIAKKLQESKKSCEFTNLANSFIIGNFFERVKEIPDGTFHLVEIDPPYAINLREAKKSDGESQYVKTDYNEVAQSSYLDGEAKTTWLGLKTMFKECYRVMSDHSWLICWFGPEPWFEPTYQALREAGFGTTRLAGIWTKPTGQSKRPEIRLANSYEMFFYAWKGQPALNKQGHSNNFNFSPVPSQSKVHPTERPIELMREVYDTFAFPGSRVLIPCLGSGVGILAAASLNMSAVGFELSKSYKDSFLIKANKMCQ